MFHNVFHIEITARALAFGINVYYFMISQLARILLAVDSLGAVGALFLIFGNLIKFAPRINVLKLSRALEHKPFPGDAGGAMDRA